MVLMVFVNMIVVCILGGAGSIDRSVQLKFTRVFHDVVSITKNIPGKTCDYYFIFSEKSHQFRKKDFDWSLMLFFSLQIHNAVFSTEILCKHFGIVH